MDVSNLLAELETLDSEAFRDADAVELDDFDAFEDVKYPAHGGAGLRRLASPRNWGA